MVETLYWLWISLISLGIGRLCLKGAFRRKFEGQSLYALGLGYGLHSLLMAALGFLGFYYQGVIWVWMAGSSLILLRLFRSDLGRIRRRLILSEYLSQVIQLSSFEKFALLLAILICVRSFLGALTPELRHDVLDYHLNFPNLYALNHGIYETPWHALSYMPANVEMLYTLALLLSSDILAKLLHFGFSLVCAGMIFHLGMRYFTRFSAFIAMLWWLLIPKIAYETSTAYIDLGVSMWAFLSFGATLRYLENLGAIQPTRGAKATQNGPENRHNEAKRWVLLAGIFAGLALGSKYTAALLFCLPLALSLLIIRFLPFVPKPSQFSIQNLFFAVAMLAVLSLLIASPWLVANYAWTGNPVYPIFNHVWGLDSATAVEAEALFSAQRPPLESLQDWTNNFFAKLNHLPMGGTLIVNLLLALGFVLLLLSLVSDSDEKTSGAPKGDLRLLCCFLVLFFSIAYCFWWLGTINSDGRFLMPAYLPACLILGVGYEYVFEWFARRGAGEGGSVGRWKERLAIGLTLLLVLNYLTHVRNFYFDLEESAWPVLGKQRQEAYLAERFSNLEMIRYAEQELPEDTLIAGLGYPTKRPYISHVKAGFHPVEDRIADDAYTSQQLLWALEEEGFTHAVIPSPVVRTPTDMPEDSGFISLFEGERQVLYQLPERGRSAAAPATP